MLQNKSIIFHSVPRGFPTAEDLTLETRPLDPTPPPGGLILQNHMVSFDPYMRGCMCPAETETESYYPAYKLNAPINSPGISRVFKSDNADFKEGEIVKGDTGMEEYTVVSAEHTKGFSKVENPHNLPLSYFLGALGMPGLIAYSSFYKLCNPNKGNTIFVSTPFSAVSSIVSQLAKREGLRVVGSADSDEKVAYLKSELGFDAAFNYKKESPWAALKRYAPEGINIYCDIVGGELLEAALESAKPWARFLGGMNGVYNVADKGDYQVKNFANFVEKKIRVRGFLVSDADTRQKYAKEHQENVAKWLTNKEIVYRESVTEGLGGAVDGFVGMLQGRNFGKAVLKISDINA